MSEFPESPRTRSAFMLPLLILLAFIVTAAFQFSEGIDSHVDPDAVIILITLLLLTLIVFCAVWKYHNSFIQLGLALIMYALGIDIIEDFTRDFTHAETILLALVLVVGFVILVFGISSGIRRIDQCMLRLRNQKEELHMRSEELTRTGAVLEKTNNRLRLLSQITRHDIANRLLAASAYLSLAQATDRADEKELYLEKVAQPLASIREIVAFAKTYEEIGHEPSRWQVIRPLIDASARQLKRENVRIENAVDPSLEIYSDKMIGKVFFNLIDNALAYGGPSLTRILFSAVRVENGLMIICQNDGVGIPPGEKERIFEQGVGNHTGLGLFLAREILSITKISIRETGDPGRNVRFEIHVPEGMYRYTATIPAK